MSSSTENVTDDVQAIEAPSTVTNSDNQPAIDYHGCYEEYVNPCQSNDVVGNETECPKAETEASDDVSRDDVPQYSKPYDTYDYGYRYGGYPYGGSDAGGCPSIHNYGYRYGGADAGICPSINTEAVAEVVTEAVVDVLPVGCCSGLRKRVLPSLFAAMCRRGGGPVGRRRSGRAGS